MKIETKFDIDEQVIESDSDLVMSVRGITIVVNSFGESIIYRLESASGVHYQNILESKISKHNTNNKTC